MADPTLSLFSHDPEFFEYMPGRRLTGRRPPGAPFYLTQRAVDAATRVTIRDDDVMSATYMKAGQTWTLAIMDLILNHKNLETGSFKTSDSFDFNRTPFMEMEFADGDLGADKFEKLDSPRVMKTHLPFELYKDLLLSNPNLKVIQTMRNPKDTLVSFYFHLKKMGAALFIGTWDQFFDQVKEKKTTYGDLFEITAEWYKFNKDRKNSLILKYEDMKKDHRGHVIKIAKFMGYDLSEPVIDLIVKKTSKEEMTQDMKKILAKHFPNAKEEPGKEAPFQFVRKGVVGDWVNYFSQEQSEYVDAQCKKYFEPLGLTFEYSA